jgi:hypothetical protein
MVRPTGGIAKFGTRVLDDLWEMTSKAALMGMFVAGRQQDVEQDAVTLRADFRVQSAICS